MRPRTLGLAMAALLLAGCNPSVEELMQEITLAELKSELRDPGSLELSETRIQVAGGVGAVCGYMNAANAYGGMAGRERFVRVFDPADMEQLAVMAGEDQRSRDLGWSIHHESRELQRQRELEAETPPERSWGLFIESTHPIAAIQKTTDHCILEARPIELKP